jgi:hypothetical protein
VRGRSIQTNLVELVHYIGQVLDKRITTQVDVIYTDFTKAFDKVDHEILLAKMDILGYSTALLELFRSYLKDRKQYVVFKGKISDVYECPSGVPQGSNLGPYLFLLYISDIHDTLGDSHCLLYADDLKLFREIKDKRDQQLLQQDLDRLTEWSDTNRIPLNIKKCGKMTFARKTKERQIFTEYCMKGERLNSYEQVKDLGVLFQRDLSFVDQIQSTSAKANRNMGILMRHSKYFCNVSTIKTLYFSLVRSNMDFASVVWAPIGKEISKALERTQKRFLRYLYYKDFQYYESSITYMELWLGYEVTALGVRRDVTILLFLRDIVNSKIESNSLLEKIYFFVPPRIGRKRNNIFNIPSCRTVHFESSPLNRAQIIYGKLEEIDNTIDIFFNSRVMFRRKIEEALLKLNQNET